MENLEDREINGLISFPCGCKHCHVVVYEEQQGAHLHDAPCVGNPQYSITIR